MLNFIDILLEIFHLAVLLINVLGWLHYRLYFFHSFVLGLTLVSWFALGLFFGLGYCFLTDLHWRVKRQLGHSELPTSYIHWIVPLDIEPLFANILAVGGLVIGIVGWAWRSKQRFSGKL